MMRSLQFRIVLILLFLLGLCLLVLRFEGEWQFSPDSLEHRKITSIRVSTSDWVLWSVAASPYYHPLVTYWIDKRYFSPPKKAENRWHTITQWEAAQSGYSGIAKEFWYKAGCKTPAEATRWIAWSNSHPELAARLWPEVIQLLRQGTGETYHLAARLMRLVENSTDKQTFDAAYGEWQSFKESLGKARKPEK